MSRIIDNINIFKELVPLKLTKLFRDPFNKVFFLTSNVLSTKEELNIESKLI